MYKLSLIKTKIMYDKSLLINPAMFYYNRKKTILKIIYYY